MHTCDECGMACYCDMDDTDLGPVPANCNHGCDEDEDAIYWIEDDAPASPEGDEKP